MKYEQKSSKHSRVLSYKNFAPKLENDTFFQKNEKDILVTNKTPNNKGPTQNLARRNK